MAYRENYEMSEEELKELRVASTPQPMMVVMGHLPPTVTECVNAVWHRICDRLWCKLDTIRHSGKPDDRKFSAESLDGAPSGYNERVAESWRETTGDEG